MTEKRDNLEQLVLDWHLEKLDDETREWFEAERKCNPELSAMCDRVVAALEPLDHFAAPAPADLADRVLKRVRDRQAVSMSAVRPVEQGGGGRVVGRVFSLRQALATAACLAMLASIMVPGLAELRERARRSACAQNLQAIYEGTQAYRNLFDGALPSVGAESGTSWLPHGMADSTFDSNSRNIFLLMKYDTGVEARHFVCPSDAVGVPFEAEDISRCDDFASGMNISYATLNMRGATPDGSATAVTPFASDTNPLFDDGLFRPEAAAQRNEVNSPVHKQRGQNVLSLDGSIAWMTSPVFGPQKDNVWLVNDDRSVYTGVEVQKDQHDAFLVPGFPNGKAVQRLRRR